MVPLTLLIVLIAYNCNYFIYTDSCLISSPRSRGSRPPSRTRGGWRPTQPMTSRRSSPCSGVRFAPLHPRPFPLMHHIYTVWTFLFGGRDTYDIRPFLSSTSFQQIGLVQTLIMSWRPIARRCGARCALSGRTRCSCSRRGRRWAWPAAGDPSSGRCRGRSGGMRRTSTTSG